MFNLISEHCPSLYPYLQLLFITPPDLLEKRKLTGKVLVPFPQHA